MSMTIEVDERGRTSLKKLGISSARYSVTETAHGFIFEELVEMSRSEERALRALNSPEVQEAFRKYESGEVQPVHFEL